MDTQRRSTHTQTNRICSDLWGIYGGGDNGGGYISDSGSSDDGSSSSISGYSDDSGYSDYFVNPFPKRRRERRYINLCVDHDGDGGSDGDGDGQRDLLVEGCSGDTMVVSVRPSDSIRGVKQKIERQVRSWYGCNKGRRGGRKEVKACIQKFRLLLNLIVTEWHPSEMYRADGARS